MISASMCRSKRCQLIPSPPHSLRTVLDHGVKVLFLASVNDQVVPVYSALFNAVDHPSILRAIYIDSAAFQSSDFITNLTVFVARLRNAGLSDHGLIYHVSEALAGSLTGIGHSLAYEEKEVYKFVSFPFHTIFCDRADVGSTKSAFA